jgi:V/A-type H+-transporting ATPase subunit E
MAGIENLKNRILKDSEEKSKQIENEARTKAEELLSGARQKADELSEKAKAKAERDGKEKKDRMISRAQLEARNDVLTAKQDAIDKVLKMSIEKIESMNDEKYSEFIEKLLLNSVESGDEEVVFSIRDRARIDPLLLQNVNKQLAVQGKKGMLKVSDETRNISTGFVLKRGGLEINCSVESQLRILRDSLEGEIANLLFEGR